MDDSHQASPQQAYNSAGKTSNRGHTITAFVATPDTVIWIQLGIQIVVQLITSL